MDKVKKQFIPMHQLINAINAQHHDGMAMSTGLATSIVTALLTEKPDDVDLALKNYMGDDLGVAMVTLAIKPHLMSLKNQIAIVLKTTDVINYRVTTAGVHINE